MPRLGLRDGLIGAWACTRPAVSSFVQFMPLRIYPVYRHDEIMLTVEQQAFPRPYSPEIVDIVSILVKFTSLFVFLQVRGTADRQGIGLHFRKGRWTSIVVLLTLEILFPALLTSSFLIISPSFFQLPSLFLPRLFLNAL